MIARIRWAIGILLSSMALATAAVLVLQVITAGMPHPLILAGTILLGGAALAWPLATMVQFDQPLCMACGAAALGFGEFGFCTHCGSHHVHTPRTA